MGFLLGNAGLRQIINNRFRLDLQVARELVDPNLNAFRQVSDLFLLLGSAGLRNCFGGRSILNVVGRWFLRVFGNRISSFQGSLRIS